MHRLLLNICVLAVFAAFPLAARARETSGPCLGPGQGGPTCHFWTARAVSVNDGDTIGVHIDGDRRGHISQVRFIGLQAMELHRYGKPRVWAGECHAVAAARFVLRMMRASHWRVRLSSQNPGARFTYRLGRFIGVKVHGSWQDLGALEMGRGLTLWMSSGQEKAWNDRYNQLGQEAALKQIGMWNPTTCGQGPSQDASLRVWANWDPPGVDPNIDLNQEWIKVENVGPRPVSVGRWWVRDSMLRRFSFPRGTVLAPGETVTVHVGHGRRAGDSFYWGLGQEVFQNIGDGAYLFDPKGDLRQYMVYPCVVACTDPNQGAIQIGVQTRGRQYVELHNVSGHPVDLYGYLLRKLGRPYIFGPGSVVAPGQTMRVDVEGDPSQDSALERHWGVSHSIFRTRGDAVKLLTFSNITVACDAWGDAGC